MHEAHLFQNLVRYLEEEEKASNKKIRKISVNLSGFAGLSKEHFLSHFGEASGNSRFKDIEIGFKEIPYGPEFEITELEYA